jgi:TonB family protein
MVAELSATDLADFGGGDSLVVDLSDADRNRSPSPDEFVAYEDPPVLISIAPPVYPEMARAAQAEGVVFVRVLVGKDGKVKDAFVRQGITMLNEAAIDAAKRAVFKPALSQHHPVEVWVEIPLRFSLN